MIAAGVHAEPPGVAVKIALLIVVGTIAAACGGSDKAGPSPAASPGTAPAVKPDAPVPSHAPSGTTWLSDVTRDVESSGARGMFGAVALVPQALVPSVHAEVVCKALATSGDQPLSCEGPGGKAPSSPLNLAATRRDDKVIGSVGATLAPGVTYVAEYSLPLSEPELTPEVAGAMVADWVERLSGLLHASMEGGRSEAIEEGLGVEPRPGVTIRATRAYVGNGTVWNVAAVKGGGYVVDVIQESGVRTLSIEAPADEVLPDHRVAFDRKANVLRMAVKGPIAKLEVTGEAAPAVGPKSLAASKASLVLLEVREDGRLLAHGVSELSPGSAPIAHAGGDLLAIARAEDAGAMLRVSADGAIAKYPMKAIDAELSWVREDILSIDPNSSSAPNGSSAPSGGSAILRMKLTLDEPLAASWIDSSAQRGADCRNCVRSDGEHGVVLMDGSEAKRLRIDSYKLWDSTLKGFLQRERSVDVMAPQDLVAVHGRALLPDDGSELALLVLATGRIRARLPWRTTSAVIAVDDKRLATCIEDAKGRALVVFDHDGKELTKVPLARGCEALETRDEGRVVAAAGGAGGRYVVRLP